MNGSPRWKNFVNWVEGESPAPLPDSKDVPSAKRTDPVKAKSDRSGKKDPRRRNASPHYVVHTLGLEGGIEHAVKALQHRDDNVPAPVKAQETRRAHRRHIYEYNEFAVLICAAMITLLLFTVSWLPKYGEQSNPAENEVVERYVEEGLRETGAVNIVAGMILDYRAFDTLGESNVLFIAVCSVILLLRADRSGKDGTCRIPELEKTWADPCDDPILRASALVLVPIGILFGIYVILNGHLSAGGGFSGGAIIGGALILYVNAWGSEKLEKYFTFRVYQWITFGSLITYTLLKTYSFYTGANGLESGIPLGTPGAILSGGLILPLNICIGLVVACTMYTFYALFRKGEL